ncbi:MAG: hypothetical protein IPP66_06225 [Anaerolineales bacterium]|nr:hypothetical protein [Anaerolineales bacterium]
MPKDSNIDFLLLVKEVFSSVFDDYGFALKNEVNWDGRGENIITASKGDVDISFYIGISPMFYYCSAAIKLSGETGEKATPHQKYRSISVSAIAKGRNPNYKRTPKGAQTKEEVKELLEFEKEDLIKYCKDILLGDISFWAPIANQMATERDEKLKALNKH